VGEGVCVVTGASGGIGRAVALALVDRGGQVWALGRNEGRLRELEEAAHGMPGTVRPLTVNLERDEEIDEATRAMLDEGDVDTLVHCAGAIALGAFAAITTEDLDRQLRVNLRAPVLLTRALLPGIRRRKGQIVFVSSLAAHGASANNAVYSATKHGLTAIADGLREELNPDGVRVLTLYPGRTATPMQVWMHGMERREYRPELLLQPDDVARLLLAALDVPRTGEVVEISIRPANKLRPL
jgi:short-subunit dehydrogenase